MENIVITEQGKQLMSKVISETESMTFTKIAVSDYDYSGIELQNISELQSVKQTAIISKISRTDGKTVEILAAINNEQIPEAYYVRTLGVYVKDSSENEILYGISISGENPDYMPAYEGKTLSGVSYRINVAVEDSEYITVNVNPAAVPTIMQVEDIDTAFREHTEDKVSHITAAERKKWDAVTEKVNKEEGKGLSHNDFTDADKKKLDGIATGANKTVIDSELSETSENPVKNSVIKKHIDDIEKTVKEEYLTKKDVLTSVNIESLKEYVGKVNIADIYRPDRYILEFSREQYDDSDPLRNVLKAGTIFYVNESVGIDVTTGNITSQFVFPAGYYEVRKDIYVVYDSDGNFVSSNDYGNSKSQIRDDGYLYLTLCDIDGETNKAEYMNIIPDTAYISNLVSELDSRISALEAK